MKVIVIEGRYYEIPDDVDNREIKLYLAKKTGDFTQKEFLEWFTMETERDSLPESERDSLDE